MKNNNKILMKKISILCITLFLIAVLFSKNFTVVSNSVFSNSVRVCATEDEYEFHISSRDYKTNDPYVEYQSYLDYLDINKSFNEYILSRIAIIDTGIDINHPEFEGIISPLSYNASLKKSVQDNDYDWSLINDENGHGTAIAGVIGANRNNKKGIVGICNYGESALDLIIIKAEYDNKKDEFKEPTDLVSAIYYACDNGANIINMSFASKEPIEGMKEAIDYATAKGVICVASSGNDGSGDDYYPACYSNVIGVGALDTETMSVESYSNFNKNVDIVAPGKVYTTTLNSGYKYENGTSFSTAMVSAVLALKYLNDYRTPYEATINRLFASCYDIGEVGYDQYAGYGLLDFDQFLYGKMGTVTFDYLADDLNSVLLPFIQNNRVLLMPETNRAFYIFDGWYYDDLFTIPYDQKDIIVSDTTLYAKWKNSVFETSPTISEQQESVKSIFDYEALSNGTLKIKKYNANSDYIVVPDSINGITVTVIGEEAFKESEVKIVILPNTIVKIEDYAFVGSSLVKIEIPDNCREIGCNAFDSCHNLKQVVISNNSLLEIIGEEAFKNTEIVSIYLPKKLKFVDGSSFENSNLKEINIDNKNEYYAVKDGILYDKNIEKIIYVPDIKFPEHYKFPDGVTSIAANAFRWNKDIKSIDLNNVTYVGDYAFAGSSLESIVMKNVTYIGEYAFCRTKISSIDLETVEMIKKFAFAECYKLKNVSLGQKIAEIPESAFEGCGIENIYIPKSIQYIYEYAFYGCDKLQKVVFEEGSNLLQINERVFANCHNLKNINLPSSLVSIGKEAFSNTGFTSFYIPDHVLSIGEIPVTGTNFVQYVVDENNPYYSTYDGILYDKDQTILYSCPTELSSVNSIKDTTKEIYPYAFYESKETYIILPEGLLKIGHHAFSNSKFYEISIPSSVTEIGYLAFLGSLRFIHISDEANLISFEGAFAGSTIEYFYIPAKYTSFDNAFYYSELFAEWFTYNLKTITFEEDSEIKTLSNSIFKGCINLVEVVLNYGSKATKIDNDCFRNFTKLQSIDYGNALIEEVGDYAFAGCLSLRTSTIDNLNSLKTIGKHAFEKCILIQEISIPNNVTSIGDYAFKNCSSLISITLSEKQEAIKLGLFYGCGKLSDIVVPASINLIENYAFLGTNNINVYFKASSLPLNLAECWDTGINEYYFNVGDVYTKDDFKLCLFGDNTISVIEYLGNDKDVDLTKLSEANNITLIAGYAFYKKEINSIILPNNLLQIHNHAFAFTKLVSISIPKSVNYIGKYAFYQSEIEEITFDEQSELLLIEKYAFANTRNLKAISIPDSVTHLGNDAFVNSGIESVYFGLDTSLTEIPEDAFMGSSLLHFSLPANISKIGHSAFRDCEKLESVDFGNSPLKIMSYAFYNTGLKEVYIGKNISYIGEYAFTGLRFLSDFNVSLENNNYLSIDGILFSEDGKTLIAAPANRTGSYAVPSFVTVIGNGAFENSGYEYITFEDSTNLLSIGYRGFYNSKIKEMYLPSSIVYIEYYAFGMCLELEKFVLDENNKLLSISEGAFYGDRKITSFNIPDTVYQIGSYAFSYSSLKEIIIPENTLEFGYGAIEKCSDIEKVVINSKEVLSTIPELYYSFAYRDMPASLKTVELNGDVTELGAFFAGFKYIENVILPKNIQILSYTFEGCESLNNVVLPDGIISITGAFKDCTSLTNVVLPDSILIMDETFKGCTALTYIELPENVTTINYAFADCINLEKAIIPNGVISMNAAFANCYNLNSVRFPEELRTLSSRPDWIGYNYNPLFNCNNLKNIVLPLNVTNIDEKIFEYIRYIENVYYEGDAEAAQTILNNNTFLKNYINFYVANENGNYEIFGKKYDTAKFIIIDDSISSTIQAENVILTNNARIINVNEYAFKNTKNVYFNGSVADWLKISFCDESTLYDVHNNPMYYADNFYILDENGDIEFNGNTYSKLTSITLTGDNISVNKYQFYGFNDLEELTIDCDTLSISPGAFNECTGLKKVSINANYYKNSSWKDIFTNTKIVEANVPDFLYLYLGSKDYIIKRLYLISNEYRDVINSVNLDYLEYLQIGSEVTIIRQFADCKLLRTVVFDENSKCETIGNSTFKNCSNLVNIVFPDSLREIGHQAFYGTSLEKVILPYGVTNIAEEAFSYITTLEYFEVPETVQSENILLYSSYSHKVLIVKNDSNAQISYSGASYTGKYNALDYNDLIFADDFVYYNDEDEVVLYDYIGESTTVTIPNNINRLTPYIFKNREDIEAVNIPNSINIIYEYAFYNCSNLKEIHFSTNIEAINYKAFNFCNDLKIYFDGSLDEWNSIEKYTWNEYSNISIICNDETVIINDSRILIDNLEFNLIDDGYSVSLYPDVDKSLISSITIPNNIDGIPVIKIANNAFCYCEQLQNVAIPDSIKTIGMQAFNGCILLKNIDIPSSVEIIGDRAFNSCGLENIVLEEGLLEIGEDAFSYCSNLTQIAIPNSVTIINNYAFRGCSSLYSVEILENSELEIIGGFAFERTKIVSILIPKNVVSIYQDAFSDCNIYEVINQSSLNITIGEDSYGSVAKNAKQIISDKSNSIVTILEDYILYEDALICIKNGRDSVLLTDNIKDVTAVKGTGYSGKNINAVYYTGSLEEFLSIGIYALNAYDFYIFDENGEVEYNGLTFRKVENVDLIIPDDVIEIESYKYRLSRSQLFTSITIPDSVEIINEYAFFHLGTIEDLYITNSIKEIKNDAFNSTTINNLYFKGTIEEWQSIVDNLEVRIYYSNLYFYDEIRKDYYLLENYYIQTNNPKIYLSKNITNVRIAKDVTNIDVELFAYSGVKNVFYDGTMEDWINMHFSYPNSSPLCKGGTLYVLDNENGDIYYDGNYYKEPELIEITGIDFEFNYQFVGLKNVIKLGIPYGTTELPDGCFGHTRNLIQLIIPETVTRIGDSVFQYRILDIVNKSENFTIGYNNWQYNNDNVITDESQIKSQFVNGFVIYNDGEDNILYSYLGNDETIIIPAYVTKIESLGVTNVKQIIYEDNSLLKSIQSNAFYNCPNLEVVHIPNDECFSGLGLADGVKVKLYYDGQNFEDYCSKLTYYSFANDFEVYVKSDDGVILFNGNLYNSVAYNDWTINYDLNPSVISSNSALIINENDYITQDLIWNNYRGALKYVEIPKSFSFEPNKFIFNDCEYLEAVFFDGTIADLFNIDFSYHRFDPMYYAKDFYILDSDGDTYFNGKYYSLVKEISIPSNITKINDYQFYSFDCLERVIIPESVIEIGDNAFAKCKNLKHIDILNQDVVIGDYAFDGCESLDDIGSYNITNYLSFVGSKYQEEHIVSNMGVKYFGNVVIDIDPELEYLYFNVPNFVFSKYIPKFVSNAKYIGPLYDTKINGVFIFESYKWQFPMLETIEFVHTNEDITMSIYSTHSYHPKVKNIIIDKQDQYISRSGRLILNQGSHDTVDLNIFFDYEYEEIKWMDKIDSNWSKGSTIYYKGQWSTAMFLYENQMPCYFQIKLNQEVIRQQFLDDIVNGTTTHKFMGWDINGDGKADFIPATSKQNLVAYPVFKDVETIYKVKYFDYDLNLIEIREFGYGEEITVPENLEKKGYQFLGFTGYNDGDIVVSDMNLYSSWIHVDGGHNYIKTVIEPTCENEGYDLYTCSICDHSYKENYVNSLGHIFGEDFIDIEATCTENGSYHHTCSRCNETFYVDIEKTGHNFEVNNIVLSTCTEEGYVEYICTNCSHINKMITPILSHNYQKVYVSKEYVDELKQFKNIMYGFENNKFYVFVCEDCGELALEAESSSKKSVSLQSAHIHQGSEAHVLIEPTCETCGLYGINCIDCNKVLESKFIDSLGHDICHHNGKEANCSEVGWYEYDTCSRCDYTTYVEIPISNNHNYQFDSFTWKGYTATAVYICANNSNHVTYFEATVTSEITKEPTDTETGIRTYTATYGNYSDTKVAIIPMLNHEYEFAGFVFDGNKAQAKFVDTLYSTYEIYYDAEIIIEGQAATCTEKGNISYVAIYEDYAEVVYKEEVAALGHDYVFSEFLWNAGLAKYVCSRDEYHITYYQAQISYVITKYATETETGIRTYTAVSLYDGYTETMDEIIPVLKHEYVFDRFIWDGNETKAKYIDSLDPRKVIYYDAQVSINITEPTCEEDGVRRYIARYDIYSSVVYEESIERIGHDFVFNRFIWNGYEAQAEYVCTHDSSHLIYYGAIVTSVVNEPTCTEPGITIYTAIYDNYISTKTALNSAALGHNFGEWHTVTEATINDEGYEERTCSRCGVSEGRTIPKLEDNDSAKIELFIKNLSELDLADYNNLIELIELYQSISDKDSVSKLKEFLQQAIDEYNAESERINNASNNATNVALIILSISSVISLAGIAIIALKKGGLL